MSETGKLRRCDILILFSYPLLPIIYFVAAAMGSAASVSSRMSLLAMLVFLAIAGCLIVVPVWTIFKVLQSKGRVSVALILGEAVLAMLWISTGIYASVVDSLRAFIALVVAAWAAALVFILLRIRVQQV